MRLLSDPDRKGRSISRDLTISLIITIAVVSSITISIVTYNDTIRAHSQLEEKADDLTTFLANALETPLWDLDEVIIRNIGNSYSQNELVSRIKITDAWGKVYIDQGKAGNAPHIDRIRKVMHNGQLVGLIEISLTSEYSIEASRQILKSTLGTIFMTLLALMIMTGFLLRMFLNKPLKQMGETVNSYAMGNYQSSGHAARFREFQPLVAVLEDMGSKITSQMDELRNAEKKYREIFENATEGIYQTAPEGRFITANPSMARILGYDSPKDLIECVKDMKEHLYVDKSVRDRFMQLMKEKGSVYAFEIQVYRKDKSIRWLSLNTHTIYDNAGNIAYYEGIAEDISERKQAEMDLAESRHYLDKIINSVADPIFVKDKEHCFILINDALCSFTGFHRDELIGKTDYALFPKNQAAVFWEKDEAVLNTGAENTNEEQITDASGTVHTIVTKKTLYKDDKGNKFIVGIIRDLSERIRADEDRKRLERQLVQAQKMEAIGTLAGGIAHDFNNILSAIIGFSELAMLNIDSSAGQSAMMRKDLEEVLKAGGRAKALVSQILTFSRSVEAQYSPMELNVIIKESLKMLRSITPSNIEIRQHLDEAGKVMSDPTQMNQVIMNLFTNAVHAMDETGGIVEVSLKRVILDDMSVYHNNLDLHPGSYLRLTISDTGHGMSPEIMERIFEPYFTTKDLGRGTGLGLSVVHGIVKGHRGDIQCKSTPAKGTVFDVYLPEIRSENEAVEPRVPLRFQPGTERILFIDDEPVLVSLAEEMLIKLGYTVVASSSSMEALEIFEKNPNSFDLVITDMTMPGMTGDRLAQKVMDIRSDIKIILCTGYNEHITKEKANQIGIREFIMKPLEMHVLTDTIRKVLDEGTAV